MVLELPVVWEQMQQGASALYSQNPKDMENPDWPQYQHPHGCATWASHLRKAHPVVVLLGGWMYYRARNVPHYCFVVCLQRELEAQDQTAA